MRRVALLLAVVAACAPDAPAEPTWADVQPILAANCVRCHGAEPKLGAPRGFRLDVFYDYFPAGGDWKRGAGAMAEFIAERAGRLGEMPPDYPLYPRQRDILERWFATRPMPEVPGALPALGDPAANHLPTAALVAPPIAAVDQRVTLAYVAADEDGELLTGSLDFAAVEACATRVLVAGGPTGAITTALHDGADAVDWDTGVLPPGDYLITARPFDATQSTPDLDVGCVTVAHASGNTAPSVVVTSPAVWPDSLYTDDPLTPAVIEFHVTEFDPADVPALRLSIEAFHGDTVLPIVANIVVPADERFTWDTSAVPASPVLTSDAWKTPFNWRLRLTISDGKASRTATSAYFLVGHEPVDERFATIHDEILVPYCTHCHLGMSGQRVPGLFQDFDRLDNIRGDPAQFLADRRGLMFRRAIQEQHMPPPLADIDDAPFGTPLPPALLERLARWLLAGAPP